jgi:hypothetical protein
MSRKFKVWLDSGANAFSNYSQDIDLEDDLGITSEEWDEMPEESRDEIMKEVAWDRMEWGFEEITDE